MSREDALKRRYVRWCLVIGLCQWLILSLPQCTIKQKGQRAPDFSLKSIDGEEISLSGLKGKIVLLDFWATWCGPCRESIPHLTRLYKEYSGKGFVVIGISVDTGGLEPVERFVKSLDMPFPVAMVSEGLDKQYGVSALPTSFLIDKEGVIQERFVGFSPKIAGELNAKISALISQRP